MSVDKDNLIKDMFNLIGIAHAEAQAIRALDISSQLKKNFDNLSDENQEFEKIFFQMITENTSFEDFLEMDQIEKEKFISNLKSKLAIN
jgi:hypothetical protein